MRLANSRTRYVSSRGSHSAFRRLIGYLFVLLLLAAVGGGAYVILDDMEGPQIVMSPDTGRIAPAQPIQVVVSDASSNIRSVKVSIHKNDQSLIIVDRTFTSASPRQELTFSLKDTGLRDGPFQLEIEAHDMAFMGLGSGNTTIRNWDMRLDTQPPRVKICTPSPALRRGSMTVIAYTISEDVEKTGVQLGERFFPAFRQANGMYYCFFPWPLDVPKTDFAPEVFSRDLAGNEARSRVILSAVDHKYRNDTMTISDSFLDKKMPAFDALVPGSANNLERYVRMNNEIRLANEQTLIEVGKNTASTMLWQGAFKRLPRSASMASFGDHRTYMHNGVKIDEQTHMGQDLASTARAPIPAANDGRVVFAGDLGIFGNLVVIDHGLGLQSLYSHMSEISVAVGDTLKKGDIIGKTGVTGLAGGDHLHFGILLHGIQIQPLDWFDAKWIRNMVTNRLAQANKAE